MDQGFWKTLKKPFFVLAPMADVTDAAFRRIIAKYGKPDVFWTEFVSADGLVLAHKKGKEKLLKNLIFTKAERPIVAQLFSSNPERMEKAAALIAELGFDGIDINMGCPDRSIEKQGAGAALMKNPTRARAVIQAAKRGAGALPISVKTRIGYSKNELETWLPEILAEEPAVITIHARTRKEMSKVPAKWDTVKRAVEIRNKLKSQTLIIGNGDVKDLEDAKQKAKETGADGIMLGRAIFGNPWLFERLQPGIYDVEPSERGRRELEEFSSKKISVRDGVNPGHVAVRKRLKVLVEHTKLFEKLFKGIKNFAVMKKHYKAYVTGFSGAAELRSKLMEAKNAKEVENIIKKWPK